MVRLALEPDSVRRPLREALEGSRAWSSFAEADTRTGSGARGRPPEDVDRSADEWKRATRWGPAVPHPVEPGTVIDVSPTEELPDVGPAGTVLVTGAAGLIGGHLVRALLRRGANVIALDDFSSGSRADAAALQTHDRVTFIEADVTSPLRLDRQVNEIYHLACPASPIHYQRDPVHTILTNVQGAVTVLELAREHKARVLLSSTSEVYGDPLEHPQRESYWGNVNPIGLRACYDEGKRCAEALFMSYHRQHDVDVRIARIFNTYGPGMNVDDGRVVSTLIVQALEGTPMTVFGDGSQTRSFCYVADLVIGLQALMASDLTVPVNLGNPREVTVLELARAVQHAVGREVDIEFRDLPSDDPRRRKPSIELAERELRWSPTTPLGVGLQRTVEDLRARV